MTRANRRERTHDIQQRHGTAKRILLGPIAPAAKAWALSGTPTPRKATVLRRIVFPPVGAAARDYEREVPAGFRFAGNTMDLLGMMIYLFGVWEPNLTTFLQRRLQPGDTFVDVGANSGWFTTLGAHLVGPTGHVVGIEASPTIAQRLQANLDRNGFDHARVLVAAVMGAPGVVDVIPGPAEHTGLTRISSDHTPAGIQVPGDTLQTLLTERETRGARIVKIDVEGAEYDVIAGLAPALDRFPSTCEFVVEVGPERASTPADVDALIETFTSRGFHPYALPNFYDLRSYMLEPVATSLARVTSRPERELDIVFSRHDADTLPL